MRAEPVITPKSNRYIRKLLGALPRIEEKCAAAGEGLLGKIARLEALASEIRISAIRSGSGSIGRMKPERHELAVFRAWLDELYLSSVRNLPSDIPACGDGAGGIDVAKATAYAERLRQEWRAAIRAGRAALAVNQRKHGRPAKAR
jgi:hypothetical protein